MIQKVQQTNQNTYNANLHQQQQQKLIIKNKERKEKTSKKTQNTIITCREKKGHFHRNIFIYLFLVFQYADAETDLFRYICEQRLGVELDPTPNTKLGRLEQKA